MATHAGCRSDDTDTPPGLEDLTANYERGGFVASLSPGRRPALLCIDFIRAYFEADSPLDLGSRACLGAARDVLELVRAARLPVVHTRVVYHDSGVDGGLFVKKLPVLSALTEGAPLGATMPEVAPQPHELVVTKQYASAFFGTSLASTLRALGVDTVIITGVTTSGCVRATTVDALQHGFVPLVVREAVADRHSRPHEANLFDLQAKYAEVVDVAALRGWLAELVGGEPRPRSASR